jgi:hypothetical protein
MHCLWRFFRWSKQRKPEDEEGQLPLQILDRMILLQGNLMEGNLREGYLNNGPQGDEREPLVQERYVRTGIGGAGNIRKSCFLFLLIV